MHHKILSQHKCPYILSILFNSAIRYGEALLAYSTVTKHFFLQGHRNGIEDTSEFVPNNNGKNILKVLYQNALGWKLSQCKFSFERS